MTYVRGLGMNHLIIICEVPRNGKVMINKNCGVNGWVASQRRLTKSQIILKSLYHGSHLLIGWQCGRTIFFPRNLGRKILRDTPRTTKGEGGGKDCIGRCSEICIFTRHSWISSRDTAIISHTYNKPIIAHLYNGNSNQYTHTHIFAHTQVLLHSISIFTTPNNKGLLGLMKTVISINMSLSRPILEN